MSPLRLLAAGLVATTAIACASDPPAQATLTAADVAKLKAAATAPADTAPPALPEDAGKLTCHATSRDVGTVDLYLKWENGSAKGVLRTTAPSGHVTMLNVGADSHNGTIVVDDVLSADLVEHAAVVKNQDGQRLMRLHGATWVTCTYAS